MKEEIAPQQPQADKKLTEYDEAILMANIALDNPTADPDDDLRTISRQFLRSTERLEAFEMANRILLNDLRDQLSKERQTVERLTKACNDIQASRNEMDELWNKEREMRIFTLMYLLSH